MDTLTERLQEKRKEAGLTQEELAALIHVPRATLANWETDRALPDVLTLQKLADLLNCSTDYLLGLTDDPTPPNNRTYHTPKEARLIENYRNSDNRGRRIIEDVAEGVNVKDDQAAAKG